jgi:ELWxxDGT repeat protein
MKNNYLFLLLISTLSFAQITQVKDINPGSTNSSSPTNLFDFNGTVFFRATDGTNGVELWKSNGTEAGTEMIKDINTTTTAASNSNVANFTTFNNQVYFTASNGTTANSTELWKTDGTSAGTTMVKDINATSVTSTSNSNPQLFTVINSTTLLFSATDGIGGTELWKTDGTEAGTLNVFDYPGTTNSITWMENLNGTAILGQIVATTGRELYKSDGATSSLISDIYTGTNAGVGTTYFKNGTTLYFQGNSGTTGFELWKTDGTTTSLVKDINPGTTSSAPIRFANVGNITFFRTNGPNGIELWQTDGTTAGTTEVADINPGAGSSTPDQIQSVNGVLYFFASDNGTNYDFYKYDNATLTKLVDFNAPTSSATVDYIELNGIIYFTADSNGDASRELWQTDGTSAGTVLVSSLISGSINPIGVSSLTKVGSKLFFAATGTDGQELFSYNPPTLSVKDQDQLKLVSIYPNPSDGNFFIDNADNETIQYQVFDVLGNRKVTGQTTENAIKLNLKSGLYILKLTKNNQASTTKIIIK